MEKGTVINNFRVTAVRRLAEINADFIEMKHDKSGAALAWLDRADANKTFSIAFKTLPEDSTGVFHILEHSVLGGSDKYPVKEPFVELLKSSVQTFLNAMTYPDKTVYPVSSRNDKDFLNLIDVYLDGVFHPLIYKKPEIFRQEGWRFEFPENAPAEYQGVVLNEMKGAYSSAASVLEDELNKILFPDNCYRHDSGGSPEHIPDLTYEHFIEMHKKYYHPSNSRISLCGSVDIEPVLALIDGYLSEYDSRTVNFDIPLQSPRPYTESVAEYEIGADEPTESKSVVSCGTIFAGYDEQKKIVAAMIIADYLAGDNESPLKRAVIDSGLAKNFKIYVNDGVQQPFVDWQAWDTDPEKLPGIKSKVESVVRSICAEGFESEALLASYNRVAFRLRDRDGTGYPRSLGEALSMLDTWIYGGDPAQPLLVEESLQSLRAELSGDYYKNLLAEMFLVETNKALVMLVPSRTLGEEKRARESARVADELAARTPEEIGKLRAEAEKLTEWQQSADTPEALATIPLLSLSDLNEKPENIIYDEKELCGRPVLFHKTGSELVYFNLYFESSDVEYADLPALSLLVSLLGKLPTQKRGGSQLQIAVKQKIGKLRFNVTPLPAGDWKKARLLVGVNFACLADQRESAADLVREILTQTVFSDKKAVKDVLNQRSLESVMALTSRGNRYAVTRASAYQTALGSVKEQLSGISNVSWLKSAAAFTDSKLDLLTEKLASLASTAFVSSRLTLGVSDNVPEQFAAAFINGFPKGFPAPLAAEFPLVPAAKEGVVVPAGVGFAAKVSNLFKNGYELNGSYYALSNILTYAYLWNEIRVLGGAYGCGFIPYDDGDLAVYSYRDPRPVNSLSVFDSASKFIKEYCASGADLTKHILGSVGDLDPLLGTEQKMAVAELRRFKGKTYGDVCLAYKQLLSTKASDLVALCDALDSFSRDQSACVVGGKAQIEACGDKIEKIFSV